MSNPRIMVTLTTPLAEFLDHVKHETGQGYAVTLRNLAIFSREFADFRKDQARQATTKVAPKTTVVVEPRCPTHGIPLYVNGLCADCETERRAAYRAAHLDSVRPPLDLPEDENKETFCEHGNLATDAAGYKQFCADCAIAEGYEVCQEHQDIKPCMSCAYEESEAAP